MDDRFAFQKQSATCVRLVSIVECAEWMVSSSLTVHGAVAGEKILWGVAAATTPRS